MNATATTAAPTERKKIAQGKDAAPAADAALGHDSPNTSSLEEAKESRWSDVPLGEVVDISPRFGKDELADDSLASFIPMKCVEEESGRFESLRDRKVAELRKGYTPFRDGDVIFAKVTPCMENGKAAVLKGLTNGVGFGSTEFFALRPKNGLEANYLFHFILQSNFRRDAARNMTGAVGLRRVPKQWLEQQTIPLPKPDEQRRIVAEIEKQFTRLEAGVAALRRVQANLKRYRAAVLKAACEGRLVPTEAELQRKLKNKNSKLETGAQLLARILTERRQNWQGRGKYKEPAAPDTTNLPSLPEGWTWTSIASLAELENGDRSKNYPSRSAFVSDGIPFINAGHLERGKVQLGEMNFISEERYALLRAGKTNPGDILFCLRGSLGKVALVADINRGAIASSLVILRSFQNSLTSYLLCYLSSWWAHQMIAKYNNGSAQPNLSAADLAKFAVPLPPLAEQTRIVAEVERRLSVVEELESVVTANLQRATRLRQSILQKAFTGAL
jgi:type I restriction enzyme S subunit